MDLALGLVDLAVEGEIKVVCALQRVGVAVEGQAGGLEVQLEVLFGYIGDGNGQVDEVLLRVGA